MSNREKPEVAGAAADEEQRLRRPSEEVGGTTAEGVQPLGAVGEWGLGAGPSTIERGFFQRKIQRQLRRRHEERDGGDSAEVKSETELIHGAGRGTSDAGGRFPYLEEIQRAFGRHDVGRVTAAVQRKATDGATCACGACEDCRGRTEQAAENVPDSTSEPRTVRRHAASGGTSSDPDVAVARGLGSSGEPLDAMTRTFMESRFGHDFADVRVHTDRSAGESAVALNADAYTVGRDIVFAPGQYAPGSDRGQRLLAHELTHVVQQGAGRPGAHIAQRRAANPEPGAAPTAGDSTARLQRLIAQIERLHARVGGEGGHRVEAEDEVGPAGDAADIRQHLSRVGQLLHQLRAVAAGSDEKMKQRVLAAFSAAGASQAESILESQVRVEVRRPAGMAARSVQVSAPGDAAEVEAERVADAVMSGGSVAVRQPATGVHRQVAEAMITGGFTVLEADAAVAPETGPPGWIVGGIVAVGALVVIGAGYVLMASHGNVSDTGIMDEARALIRAGTAATLCAALQILWDQARSDSARRQRIKATQKAQGCRHSRHS